MSGAEETDVLLGAEEEIALDKELDLDTNGINGKQTNPSVPARILAFVKGFFKGKKSMEVEEIEDFVPTEEAVRELRANINTAALLVLAIVAIGMALIFLEFVLVPLVLARFFVYLFQPLINFMVGKKHFGHRRLRVHFLLPPFLLLYRTPVLRLTVDLPWHSYRIGCLAGRAAQN